MSDPQLEQLHERARHLANKNDYTIRMLAQKKVALDPRALDALRLEMFITHLLGDTDKVDRMKFEVTFLEKVEKALENTTKDAAKQEALSKLHLPNGVQRNHPDKS